MFKKCIVAQFIGLIFVLVMTASISAQEKGLEYGLESALPELHVFLSNQFLDYQKHEFGKYANEGDTKLAGYSVFVPMSGYIDISSQLTQQAICMSTSIRMLANLWITTMINLYV